MTFIFSFNVRHFNQTLSKKRNRVSMIGNKHETDATRQNGAKFATIIPRTDLEQKSETLLWYKYKCNCVASVCTGRQKRTYRSGIFNPVAVAAATVTAAEDNVETTFLPTLIKLTASQSAF